MKNKIKSIFIISMTLVIGIIVGGYLFSDTQPRSVISLNDCQGQCLKQNDFIGLLASTGIQLAPNLLPEIVKETKDTIVILHPNPVATARTHYVIIPKRDIKNIGEISTEDIPSIIDIYAVAVELIEESKFSGYRMWSNGLDSSGLSYLHFHLAGG